jgi:hypothetical protein
VARNTLATAAKAIIASVAVLIPCFWQPSIQAGDLSSHLYNAWLTLEHQAGRVSGLTLAPVWTNSLFDRMLEATMKSGGPWAAEHVCTAVAVLTFFWGLIACTTNGSRSFWSVLPLAAMLVYGTIFRLGFLNFYLATAISLWGMAVFFYCGGWLRFVGVPIFAIAILFHAAPVAWAVGVLVFVEASRRLPEQRRVAFFALAAMVIVIGITAIRTWMHTESPSPAWSLTAFLSAAGVIPYCALSDKYIYVCLEILLVFYLVAQRHVRAGAGALLLKDPLVHACGLMVLACVIVPEHMYLPMYAAPFGFIDMRLAFFTAILTLVLLSRCKLKGGELMILYVAASLFFYFSWVDERTANLLEHQITKKIADVPAGARVVAVFSREPLQMSFFAHAVDRACIGRCLSYANYEPTTMQFRLRALPHSPAVLPLAEQSRFEGGTYVVRPQDAPLFVLRACRDGEPVMCTDKLEAGATVERRDLRVQPEWW